MEKLRNIICLFLLLLLEADMPIICAQGQDGVWQLVFSDEFNGRNGSQPDTVKWVRSPRGTSRWSRWISNSKKVVFISGGHLVCRAIPNKDLQADTARMLTGAIESLGKFEFQYGKVEVRMKTNLKQGNFPAVWLRPSPSDKDSRYGEIDIVEMFGNQGKACHTVYSHMTYQLKKEGAFRDFNEQISVNRWHIYGIEWTKDYVLWTVDGKTVAIYRKSTDTKELADGQWTFDRPFYLRLNQSVGDGQVPYMIPDTNDIYETRFDWIRVYQRVKR